MYLGHLVTKRQVNLSSFSAITGFDISGTGKIYVLFNVSGVWKKIENGKLVDVPTQEIDQLSVMEEGNTAEELSLIDSVPELAGKKINVAITAYGDDAPPKFKFGIKGVYERVELVKTVESEEYALRGDIQSMKGDCTENVKITVSGFHNGKWLPYVSLDKAGTNYEKVKFRATMTVTEVGQKAEFNGVTLVAKPNDAVIPSNTVALYTSQPVKNSNLYVVGNNKGIINAFCSKTTPAQWKQLERITENSFRGAEGQIKITLTADSEETPSIKGYVIREG